MQSVDSTISLATIFSTLTIDSAGIANDEYVHLDTDVLVEEALVSIVENAMYRERLLYGGISSKELLRNMLLEAPHPNGKRYIALTLHVVAQKGSEEVERLAKVLLDDFLLPLQAQMSIKNRVDPSSSQTPTIDDTASNTESAEQREQRELSKSLFIREEGRCAITHSLDPSLVPENDKEVVDGVSLLEAAHILPFALNTNNFTDPTLAGTRTTWHIFKNWTGIDLDSLVIREKINTSSNAILMNISDLQAQFAKFKIWFEPIPGHENHYTVKTSRRVRLLNGKVNAIARFRSREDSSGGIELPDPAFLRIHAALAKVLHACGAVDVFDEWERDFRQGGGVLVTDKQSMVWVNARLNLIPVTKYNEKGEKGMVGT
ncbi:hypothetical protein BDN70DRAFT_886520 [Pholiota conissans]|uniref:HNH nuclease domain-containing protein n=1 Tax=Pholiota conissans TaxID=109636 RepID=A0A9P5YP80_9AGAR|nr:hypothetical protein BDN70DRAFT_886520 [Pholiota conissans]